MSILIKLIVISATMFCLGFFLTMGVMCGVWLTEWVNKKREGKE